MSGRGGGARIALILGSLLAGVLGWFLVSTFGPSDEAESAPGAIDLYSCPIDGAQSIGQLQPGADVWLIGVSAGRWGVIRHPDDPDRLAWVPLAQVSTAANRGQLPEMGCDQDPVTGTTAPPTTIPKPVIGTIGVVPGDCSITVTVGVANATSATVTVTGGANNTSVALTPVPGTASAIVALAGSTGSTTLTITATATGAGGTATAATTFLASSCKL